MSNQESKTTSNFMTGLVLFGGVVSATAIFYGCSNESPAPVSTPVPAVLSESEASPPELPIAAEKTAPVQPGDVEKPKAPTKELEVAIAHDDAVDHSQQAQALLSRGERKAALVAMRKHLHTVEPTADNLLTVGRLAREVNEFALARVALKQARSLEPRRADVSVEFARVHLDSGHARKAEREARRALRFDRDSAPAWNQLGRAAMAQSRWELAETSFKRAVHLDPVDGLAHNNLGLLYVYMKDGEKAADILERAVELMEDDTPYYVFNNLGLAHELLGQHEEAREAFEEALLLNPFYTKAKVNLDRIEARIAATQAEEAFETATGGESEADPMVVPDDA